MKRPISSDPRLLAACALAAVVATASPLGAHGAMFLPPPPGWEIGLQGSGPGQVPSPNQPPTRPPGPATPGAPQSQPGQPPAAAPQAPNTATTPSTVDDNFDRTNWTLWWELNAEPFLELRRHVRTGGNATGEVELFLGQGEARDASADLGPSALVVRDRIVPALLETLGSEEQNDVLTGCLVALARIGDDLEPALRAQLAAAIRASLANGNQEVAETAAAALGILGDDRSAALLGDLLLDRPAGREARGGGKVPGRTRAFAAYGLGILASETGVEDVRRFAAQRLLEGLAKDTEAEVRVACVLGLGLVPIAAQGPAPDSDADERPPSTSREALVAHLLEVLDDDPHRLVRANVPISLGRLLRGLPGDAREPLKEQVASDLLKRVSKRSREPAEVLQSCVIALGMLGDNDGDDVDVKIRKALRDVPKTTPDQLARRFALIASARVGGRMGRGNDAGIAEVRTHLVKSLVKGNTQIRDWSALALGVLEHGVAGRGQAPRTASEAALRDFMKKARTPSAVGSGALGAGLARDLGTHDAVLAAFLDLRDDRARGFAAVSLGLMGARVAIAPLNATAREALYRPVLLRDTATGLGLLGDKELVPVLVKLLVEARSLASQSSVAAALGRIGDARSVEPLVEMLLDDELTDLSRSFAAVALGIVADEDPLPWNTVLSVDCNYAAAPVTLFDLEGFGILNIL